MIVLSLISIIIVLIPIFYYLSKRQFDYWEKRGVPYESPTPLFGNFADFILLRKFWGQVTQALCQRFSKEPYFGVFFGTEPALVVQDPELLRLITTKDFYYFSSREVSEHTHKETVTQNLFFTQGDRWKVLRQNMTPLFTTTKMKSMFHLIEKCNKSFVSMLADETRKSSELDVRYTMVRYSMDCVTSSAFGVNSEVMGKNTAKNPFKVIGDLIFELSKARGFKIIARSMWPDIFYGLGFKVFPEEINNFFSNLIMDVFRSRDFKPSPRYDFVDLMLNLKQNKYLEGDKISNMSTHSEKKERISLEMSDELLVGQCMVFFAAGFETSATTMTFTLFELAKHETVQKKVQEEIDQYLKKTKGKVLFDCMTELPYLTACVNEAMRLYPVLAVLTREVVEQYTLPTGLELPKGMRVHVPVYHLHHSAEYFPNPEEYRPERFLGEEKDNIVPYTYMPFGEGQRICIGMRFARMQMMAGLVTLLSQYSLRLAAGMPRAVDFETKTFVTQAISPIRLKFINRTDNVQLDFQHIDSC